MRGGISRRRRGALRNSMTRSLRRPFLNILLALVPLFVPAQTMVANPYETSPFAVMLSDRFKKVDPAWTFEGFCPVGTNVVAARVIAEYGAMFAAESVVLPGSCVYRGESDVLRFQKTLKTKTVEPRGIRITLQESAGDALQKAITEAQDQGLSISPLDGAIAGSRSYGDTLMLWNGRFFSGLDHWTRNGRLTTADRDAISRLDLQKRIEKIMEWETQCIYFSTGRTKSIFSSVAPPGTSQHLSMVAFDVVEYGRPDVIATLNRNGWYQTVVGDPPHFTYLGLAENELPNRGLLQVAKGGYRYWIPNISTATR